ncbi:OmpA family protein, partial [Pseudoroseomonas globiformis]
MTLPLRTATLLVVMVCGLSPLQAEPISGFYLGAGAGLDFRLDSDTRTIGVLGQQFESEGAGRDGTAKYNMGGVGVLSLGYGFGNGLRAEAEANLRGATIDSYRGHAGLSPWGAFRGEAYTYGVMANLLYDFQIEGLPVTPYLGGGVGYAWTELSNVRATSRVTGDRLAADGTWGNFAYQGMAGAAFPIVAVPGLAVTAEYRFFGQLDNDYKATLWRQAGPPQRGKLEFAENLHHSAMVGIRYAFNQAPPPVPVPVAPAPAAAPAPARTYLVFFDFDRADLTDRARQIISEAAQNSGRVQATRIEVAGHADRAGSPQYNQRLSQRRA